MAKLIVASFYFMEAVLFSQETFPLSFIMCSANLPEQSHRSLFEIPNDEGMKERNIDMNK